MGAAAGPSAINGDDLKQKAFELPSKLDVAKQSTVKKQSGTQ